MKFLLSFVSLLFCMTYASAFEDPTVDVDALQQLWDGRHRYYQFEFNGKFFQGKRPWKVRWDMMSNGVNWSNKRVLELGANMGLCSLFLSKYAPVKSVVAIDKLPTAVEYMRRLQEIFQTKFPVYVLDLDDSTYETVLGYEYDVVLCMSLYRWVHDKDRLLRYLSHFSEVLYEGHDSPEVEIARFEKLGFSKHAILGTTDARRSLIHFSK